jgi:hypothetical protein
MPPLDETRKTRAARTRVGLLQVLVLWLALALGEAARAAPIDGGMPLIPGAFCGFVVPCTRIGEIGLHIAALGSLHMDKERSSVDMQGALRGSVTFLDVAEIGGVLAGHVGRGFDGALYRATAPASIYARVRLLPLPLPILQGASFRLTAQWQHDFVTERLGGDLPDARSKSTLSVTAGRSLGPVDLDGSVGFVLLPRPDDRPQLAAYQVSAALSVWLKRPQTATPTDQFRLHAEGLAQFSLDPHVAARTTVLFGVLGLTHTGYGGGLALGPERSGAQTGLRVLANLQFSWGPHVRNPWAEKKAAEPKQTPQWVWTLLGAIDPVLRSDGCVWTDATPKIPSHKWFCIGTPDPFDTHMIVLKDGQRLPVGTHLQEHGAVLRLNDGTKVIEIPSDAKFQMDVERYVEALLEADERSGGPDRALCEGRVGIAPRGISPGLESVHVNDDMGGGAAALGMAIYQAIICNPDVQAEGLWPFLLARGLRRGPLRARPLMLSEPRKKPTSGGGTQPTPTADVAEHVTPAFVPKAAMLTSQSRQHIFEGEINSAGRAIGWHHEPSGKRSRGTYVLEGTRSAPDGHGVYTA